MQALAQPQTMALPADDAARWSVRVVDPEGAEWRALLASTQHTLFHEPVWARITQRGFGGEVCALSFERDGEPAAGVLGFWFRSLWARLLQLNFPYGGIIGPPPSGGELSRLLRAAADDLGIARIRLNDSPALESVAPTDAEHLALRSHVLDLGCGDYDALWKGFKSRIRRDVRKSERAGVVALEASSPAEIDEFYGLYRQSMERNRALAKYTPALMRAIYEELVPLGRAAFLLARREGEPIAGVLVVDSPRMSHYLIGGSSSAGLQYCPNDLLLHTAIRRAVERGLGGFDFLPSGIGDEALERFKTKWGAEPVPTAVHTIVTKPAAMRAWDLAYRVAETPLGSALVNMLRR